MKVPSSISFERPFGDFFSRNSSTTDECTSSASSVSHSGDELQALNTALCFLASINADVQEINAFLLAHPQALLLDGAGPIPEESARNIVEQQLQRCRCFSPTCQQNRLQTLEALDRGFEHYETQRWWNGKEQTGRPIPRDFIDELAKLERQICTWRSEELALRHRLLEAATELRVHQAQLNRVNAQSRRSFLLCSPKSDVFARRSVLEYRVGLATLNLGCVGREHGELLHQIRRGRLVQFKVLKRAFAGCRRHVCAVQHSAVVPDTVSHASV